VLELVRLTGATQIHHLKRKDRPGHVEYWNAGCGESRMSGVDGGKERKLLPIRTHAEGMGGLFVDGTSYWLGPEQEGMIEQHSLGDNTVLATFGVVPSAEGITIIGSTLWYTSYRQRLLAAVDLRTGQELQRYRLPGDPTGMCWDGTQLWYCDYMHRQLCALHLPVFEGAGVPS
jgi:glutamine cyclotransferase